MILIYTKAGQALGRANGNNESLAAHIANWQRKPTGLAEGLSANDILYLRSNEEVAALGFRRTGIDWQRWLDKHSTNA